MQSQNGNTRIVIIGAGIAGLSAYLFLHKHLVRPNPGLFTVTIYEAYDVHQSKETASRSSHHINNSTQLFTPKIIGNAIGIGRNGLSVVARMDDTGDVLKTVQAMGNAVSGWKMGTARGWKIVDANVRADDTNGDVSSGAGTL